MNQNFIHIVIPVYNHGKELNAIVDSLQQLGYRHIIVVNDGSGRDIFNGSPPKGISYLKHRVNLGQGAALQTGFLQALKNGAQIVVCFDADGQHNPHDIQALVAPLLNAEADLTTGSRFLSEAPESMPWGRRLLVRAGRFVNYLFTGILLTDAHNGLRALNRNAIEKIRITENRMAHATEILFEVKKHGLILKEVPVNINYTAYSRRHGQSSWNSIKIFFDILFYKLFT